MRAAVMFSGAAGSSVGARQQGLRVVWAANHEPRCVETHLANFPDAQHVCEDLVRFDHGLMPEHDALIASPVCRAHSRASQPARALNPKIASRHNAFRATWWSVLDAVEMHEPGVVVIENVPEAREWKLYSGWRLCLESLGYTVTEACLTASRWGVPQQRERLFVVALRSRKWLSRWLRDPNAPEPAMHDSIDWDAGEWLEPGQVAGVAAREQIERAHAELRRGPGFVMQVSHRPVYPSSEPIRTMTTKNQLVLVNRGKHRRPTVREAFNLMGFPQDYILPTCSPSHALAMAGDAVCPPVMRGVLEIALG